MYHSGCRMMSISTWIEISVWWVEDSVTGTRLKKAHNQRRTSPFGVWGRGNQSGQREGSLYDCRVWVFWEVESSTPLHEVWEDLGSGVLSSITSQA